jgi:hypothetical protein
VTRWLTRSVVALIGLTVLLALLYFSGFIEGFISGFQGHAGMPSCESSHGQSDAKRAIENSPLAKTSGVAVLTLTDVRQISATTQKVECTAMVILSNAQKGAVNYSFTQDPSLGAAQYYVRTLLDLPSFKPYSP